MKSISLYVAALALLTLVGCSSDSATPTPVSSTTAAQPAPAAALNNPNIPDETKKDLGGLTGPTGTPGSAGFR